MWANERARARGDGPENRVVRANKMIRNEANGKTSVNPLDGNVEESEGREERPANRGDKAGPQLQSPAAISLTEAFSARLLWRGLKPDLFDLLPDDSTTGRVRRNSYSPRWAMGFGVCNTCVMCTSAPCQGSTQEYTTNNMRRAFNTPTQRAVHVD